MTSRKKKDKQKEEEQKRKLREQHKSARESVRQCMREKIGVEQGWILRFFEKADHIFDEYVSLLNWLTKWKPEWYGNYSVVEIFVVAWFVIELAFFSSFLRSPFICIL